MANSMDLARAIERIRPGAAYRLNDDDTTIIDWRGPGTLPTQAELDAAWTTIQAEDAKELNVRQTVITTAQSAVGVPFRDLTAAQRNALIVALLFRRGAIDRDGRVRPLEEWM